MYVIAIIHEICLSLVYLFGFKSLKFRTKDAKNERNLKETLFQINFQLRRSQDMYSKAQNIENFKAVQFYIQELIIHLFTLKRKF